MPLQATAQFSAVRQVLDCVLSYWRHKTKVHRLCCSQKYFKDAQESCVHVMLRADLEPEIPVLPDVHSIHIFCLISGRTLSSWAQNLRSQDFQLLCRNGSTADVTEWRTCHLARIPARAVVVRPDTDGTVIFQLLNQGQVGHHFLSMHCI